MIVISSVQAEAGAAAQATQREVSTRLVAPYRGSGAWTAMQYKHDGHHAMEPCRHAFAQRVLLNGPESSGAEGSALGGRQTRGSVSVISRRSPSERS